MHPERKVGHNVVHLIYPIRVENKKKHINQYFKDNPEKWEHVYHDEKQTGNQNQHEQNIHYNFPGTYSVEPFLAEGSSQKSYRHWIDNKALYSYFHPSVQRVLFQENKKMQIYRKKTDHPRKLIGEFSKGYGDETLPKVVLEWISSEVYLFSEESGFLVARVSLLENVSAGELIEHHDKPVHSLNIWMKFLNRIRQNYHKFAAQPRMLVSESNETAKLFFQYLENELSEDMNIFITGIDVDLGSKKKGSEIDIERRTEANCYVHAFAQSNLTNPLSLEEKYQFVMIDDYDGESGGDSEFKKEFIKDRIYARWAPDTYYTAIDYGSVTIADCKTTCYKGQEQDYAFPDLLYQHHTRHYLFFILIQLYYRDELQEIMGRYAGLESFKNKKHIKKAKQILSSYYNLNQHFFFDRITHEIQGLEMWKFYQKVMDTKELYRSVQEDMKELNARLIETSSDKQNIEIRTLTIVAAITGMLGMNIFVDEVDDVEGFPVFYGIFENLYLSFILQLVTLTIIVIILMKFVIWDSIKKMKTWFNWRNR